MVQLNREEKKRLGMAQRRNRFYAQQPLHDR